MIQDKELFMSEAQAIAATAVSSKVIDLGPKKYSKDNGAGMELLCQIKEAFTAAGAATLEIQLQSSSDEAFSAPKVLAKSDVIAKADLVLGAEIFEIKIPKGADRYLRLNYVVASGPFTAGQIDASLVLDRQAGL